MACEYKNKDMNHLKKTASNLKNRHEEVSFGSTTAGGGNNFQYIEGGGKKSLCYLNTNQNTYFYDYEEETLDYQLRIEKKGQMELVKSLGSWFIPQTQFSIFKYWCQALPFKPIRKNYRMYDPKTKEGGLIVRPYVSGNMPMMKRGKHIFEFLGSRKNIITMTRIGSLLLRVNLETKERITIFF